MNDWLHDILEASVDGICVFGRDHRCVIWSPAMERLTGVSADRALGQSRDDLLPDGGVESMSVRFTAASHGGVVGIARTTEKGVTQLISLASHKLRTPLTALQIHLGYQLRTLQHQAPEREWLEKSTASAVEQASRLGDAINLLLDVSRIDSGRWKLERVDFDLGALTRQTVDRLRGSAADAGCEVRCTITGDTHGKWDRQRLEEVLANLLANAFKHSGRKPVDVTLEGGAAEVVLVVADHGPGIDPAELPQVFERTTARALGLWITREIVRAHHGTIEVTSGTGAGATFTVKLPKR